MPPSVLPVDAAALARFESVVEVRDSDEMAVGSKVSGRMLAEGTLCRYRLQDRGLFGLRFDDPITTMADQRFGGMWIALSGDRFGVEAKIGGEGIESYCFTVMLRGKACIRQRENEITVAGADGAAWRLLAGTRLLASDDNARRHLWIKADALQRALEEMLDDRLRRPIEFAPAIDWSRGLAASLGRQIDFLMHEMAQADGVADNPLALASLTDLILSLVLRGLPHNYLERLRKRRPGCVPAYVRRAEDFMRANAAFPIRMQHVAEAAGCSVRTLGGAFRRFRETTPLAALSAIRFDQVRAELIGGPAGASVAEVAHRYGFTNASRFSAGYRRRFGETPSETLRRGSA